MSTEQTHPLIQFVQTRGRTILTGALIAAVALTLAYRMLSSRQASRVSDFIQAELELEQLAGSESEATAALTRLDQIFGRHAELHQKYDGPIAQSLLKQDQGALSEPFADQVLHRATPRVAAYSSFTETSLLIARAQHETALEKACALQTDIELATDDHYGEVLRLSNLIRIAFLCQELGKTAQEQETWLTLIERFEHTALQSPIIARMRQEVLNTYRDGQITILDYARARIETLSAKA